MKRPLAAILLFVSLLVPGRAGPAEELDDAIRALLAQPNFSWKATFQRTENGRNCSYDGRTERGGFTIVTTARQHLMEGPIVDNTERPVVIVFVGDRGVAKLEDAWLTPQEVHAQLTQRASGLADVMDILNRVQQEPRTGVFSTPTTRTTTRTSVTTWNNVGRICVPRPDLILSALLGELENARSGGRSITAAVGERAVIRLFESKLATPEVDPGVMGIRVSSSVTRESASRPASNRSAVPTPESLRPGTLHFVRFQDGTGEGTFWIVGGTLAKFELRLAAFESQRDGSQGPPHHVVITAIMDDVGKTVVEVPAGARERLELR